MIKLKVPLTEEEKSFLDVGIVNALRFKINIDRDLRVLPIIDKIDWSNDMDTLRVLYYELYNRFGEYYSEDKEMIRERLVAILDEPFDEYIKKMDMIRGFKRK